MLSRSHCVCLTLLNLLPATALAAEASVFNRTVIVRATGDPSADGVELIEAIETLHPAPSQVDRWLVKLEPGTYDVGSTPLVMREHVDVEGSGTRATTIRGSAAPEPGHRLGGLVVGASHSELRALTVACRSDDSNAACQAMSLHEAHTRLIDVRFLVEGTGTGSHWGIRTFDSRPVLKDVEIRVRAENSFDNYGIVYGGASTLDVSDSTIEARDASNSNVGVVLRDSLGNSTAKDTLISASGGRRATGILFLGYESTRRLSLDDVVVSANRGTDRSAGIATDSLFDASLDLWVRGGRILGKTAGIDLLDAERSRLRLLDTEVFGKDVLVAAGHVGIASTWLRGGGSIEGHTVQCAGVYDGGFTFYDDTCPGVETAPAAGLTTPEVSLEARRLP